MAYTSIDSGELIAEWPPRTEEKTFLHLEPYREYGSRCVKCGGVEHNYSYRGFAEKRALYQGAFGLLRPIVAIDNREHIHVTCARCGFAFYMEVAWPA